MTTTRYYQLIADLASDYRPQREWAQGRGMLIIVGHFLVGIAGGTWLLAMLYHVTAGLFVAYALGALGGIAHLMFLGRPKRAFKMMRHVRASWVSRGFIGLSAFLCGASVFLAMSLMPFSGAWAAVQQLAYVIAAIGSLTMIGYMGFAYAASKGIPFWQSSLHPALYIAFAIRGGTAAMLVIAAVAGTAWNGSLVDLWVSVTGIVALLFIFEMQGAWTSGNTASRWSVRDMLVGRLAVAFYGGTLGLGIIVPVLLLASSTLHSAAIMGVIGIASVAGDFFMKMSTVKAGVYLPLALRSGR